ncbi:MAG TPA: DUF5666 domain-containing protein [Solirubrobacterales bacterium]|nr:DUF5666 domain-containing protein [Solirubrobacterales bacterium]
MTSKRVSLLIATAALAATATLAAIALPAQAALRHIDGTVLSKNSSDRSFRIKTQAGARVRIKVSSTTRFQRIPGGFGGIHQGLRVEVEAKSTAGGLVATEVETRQGGGGDGADDHGGHGGGSDDGPNHT